MKKLGMFFIPALSLVIFAAPAHAAPPSTTATTTVLAQSATCASRNHLTLGDSFWLGPYGNATYSKCLAKRVSQKVLSGWRDASIVLCGALSIIPAGWFAAGVCAVLIQNRYAGIKSAWKYAVNHRGRCPQLRVFFTPPGFVMGDPSHVVRCFYP